MLGVFSDDISKAIHTIYKNKELYETKTMLFTKLSDGVSFNTYSLEMVIAIAFRIG